MGAIPATFNLDYTKGIQKFLAEALVQDIGIDGNFGPASIAALQKFQLQKGIPTTGLYDSATQALADPAIQAKYLLLADFQAAATDLGCEVAAIKAVQETETSGAGFVYTGKVRILFERHWMYRFLQRKLPAAQFQKIQAANPDIINEVAGGYATGPTLAARAIAEYTRFSRAFAIDPVCAMMSASWGLFQIMGFNASFAGFKNADGTANVGPFVDSMKVNEKQQLKAFVSFIKTYAGGGLWTAIKQRDWIKFAQLYNGMGNYREYAQLMGNNYTTFAHMYG